MHRSKKRKKSSICWDCEKATGGCPWSDKGEVVKGWKAKKTVVDNKEYGLCETYRVIDCPEFKEGIIHFLEIIKNEQM